MASALDTPLTWVPLYLCFLLSRETLAETVLGSLFVQVLTLIAVFVGILGLRYAAEPAWLRLGLMALLMTGGLYMDRATIIPLAGPNLALIWGMIFTLPDTVPFAEVWVRFCLWFLPLALLGIGATVIATILIPPTDPLDRLLRELADRIAYAAAVVANRALPRGEQDTNREKPAFRPGVSQLLELAKLAEVQHRAIKKSAVDLRSLVTLVDRLAVAAHSLHLLDPEHLEAGQKQRLQRLARACQALGKSLKERRRPTLHLLSREREQVSGPSGSGPATATMLAVFEMERILRTVDLALRFRTLDVAQNVPKPKRKFGIFLPDAFTNPEYIQFALKGTLAAFLCYFVYTSINEPGIRTAMVTCMVVALSTSGAVIHKMTLRITGACIGGLLAVLSVVFLVPHMQTVTSLALLIAAGTFLSAWVAVGSTRTSYAGWQIALAFFMTVIHGNGPATDLVVVRDRLIGILLGNFVMGLVFTWVLPQRAGVVMWRSLAESLFCLARLIGIPTKDSETRAVVQAAEPVRREFYEQIEKTQAYAEQAVFEPHASSQAGQAARRGVLDTAAEAETLALLLQTIVFHRDDTLMRHVPESVREQVVGFHSRIGRSLENSARRLLNRRAATDPPPGDNDLLDFEQIQSVLVVASREAPAPVAGQIRGRIALYGEIAGHLKRLGGHTRALQERDWFRAEQRVSPT